MVAVINHTGLQFGRLTVLEQGESSPSGKAKWWCECQCGQTRLVFGSALKSGNTVSCGCWKVERAARDGHMLNRRHGMTKSRSWITWSSMIQRCSNPNHKSYRTYGGRGIRVCEQWLTFENFLADMGPAPDGLTLDRRDVRKGYEPGNCRWATMLEQARNKRNNLFLDFQGERLTLSQWAERYKVHRSLIRDRIGRGWPMEEALTIPAGRNGKPRLDGKRSRPRKRKPLLRQLQTSRG